MIYTHVLNRPGVVVDSPADRLTDLADADRFRSPAEPTSTDISLESFYD